MDTDTDMDRWDTRVIKYMVSIQLLDTLVLIQQVRTPLQEAIHHKEHIQHLNSTLQGSTLQVNTAILAKAIHKVNLNTGNILHLVVILRLDNTRPADILQDINLPQSNNNAADETMPVT